MAVAKKTRTGMAAVLTAIAVGIGVALTMAFGPVGLLLYGITLPVPLILLWLSADVLRSDEHATYEAEPAERRPRQVGAARDATA